MFSFTESTKRGADNVRPGSNDYVSPHHLWRLHQLTYHGFSLTSSGGGNLASLFDGAQLRHQRTHGKPAVGSMGWVRPGFWYRYENWWNSYFSQRTMPAAKFLQALILGLVLILRKALTPRKAFQSLLHPPHKHHPGQSKAIPKQLILAQMWFALWTLQLVCSLTWPQDNQNSFLNWTQTSMSYKKPGFTMRCLVVVTKRWGPSPAHATWAPTAQSPAFVQASVVTVRGWEGLVSPWEPRTTEEEEEGKTKEIFFFEYDIS